MANHLCDIMEESMKPGGSKNPVGALRRAIGKPVGKKKPGSKTKTNRKGNPRRP